MPKLRNDAWESECLSCVRPIEKKPRPILPGLPAARSEAEDPLGQFSALLRQVGALPDVLTPSETLTHPVAAPAGSSRAFLENYLRKILLPLELPAIIEACGHTARGELRELIAQDQRLAAALSPTPFAEPSQQVGRLHLARLRPLRDDRLVQRFLKAVESGQTCGSQALVYGVTLAVYSLPLRQGLLFYGQETLASLAGACDDMLDPGFPRFLGKLGKQLFAAVSASLPAVEALTAVQP
jgi:hypothetical protein